MRVSKKMLENKVDQLNKITNSPMEYFKTTDPTDNTINTGHFCLDNSYGGWELQRTCNSGGGVNDYLHSGHVPKRQLYDLISAFIDGIELEQDHMNELLNEWKLTK
tara:strand:+ start:418 stop:735 length:318 start_codon:yes stop_codon:yes gene_type:complete